jgi:hypothetical protein
MHMLWTHSGPDGILLEQKHLQQLAGCSPAGQLEVMLTSTVSTHNAAVWFQGHDGGGAAAGAARAPFKQTLSVNLYQQLPQDGAAAGGAGTGAPHLASKDQLAAQIAVKEKVLKLLQKQKASADAATKQRLQRKLDKLIDGKGALQLPGPQPAAAAAAAAGKAPVQTLAKLQLQQHKHKQQPLAAVKPALAATPAELVGNPCLWQARDCAQDPSNGSFSMLPLPISFRYSKPHPTPCICGCSHAIQNAFACSVTMLRATFLSHQPSSTLINLCTGTAC